MISLSDAIRLESNNRAVNTFKPWWEIGVDYSLNAFLLVVLFALAGVTLSGTPGLVCLAEDRNVTSFNYVTSNYVNAKCTTHVNGHVLIIFPYIIFAQWLILFVLHLSWFNLPASKAFLSSSFDTFMTFKQLGQSRPQVKHRSDKKTGDREEEQGSKSGGDESSENHHEKPVDEEEGEDEDDDLASEMGRQSQLMYLVDWLRYMLQFRYNVVNIYAAKSFATCVFTAIITVSITSWLVAFRWKAAFTCDLHGHLPPPYDLCACSFAAAPYVYSMMILNVIFAILLFIFNVRALLWLAQFRLSFSHYFYSWKEAGHPLRDKPGFYDYFFCIKLLKSNSPEGLVVFNMMELAFKAFANRTPNEEAVAASEFSLVVPEEPGFHKAHFILTEVLREMGMVRKRSVNSSDDLWAALANSASEDGPALSSVDLQKAAHDVCERVVKVVLDKHVLFKDLINKDNHCPVYEDYIEDIKNEVVRENGILEDHYVLMAYAIACCCNVVVIRAQKSSLLYEPEQPEENQSVRFITFIPPRYYYASSMDPKATAEQKDSGLKFLTDQVFQTALVKRVTDLWETKGYQEYKSCLKNILPQELSYQPDAASKQDLKRSSEDEGLRQRFGKSGIGTQKAEQIALVERV